MITVGNALIALGLIFGLGLAAWRSVRKQRIRELNSIPGRKECMTFLRDRVNSKERIFVNGRYYTIRQMLREVERGTAIGIEQARIHDDELFQAASRT
jgi:hypothetical protein